MRTRFESVAHYNEFIKWNLNYLGKIMRAAELLLQISTVAEVEEWKDASGDFPDDVFGIVREMSKICEKMEKAMDEFEQKIKEGSNEISSLFFKEADEHWKSMGYDEEFSYWIYHLQARKIKCGIGVRWLLRAWKLMRKWREERNLPVFEEYLKYGYASEEEFEEDFRKAISHEPKEPAKENKSPILSLKKISL